MREQNKPINTLVREAHSTSVDKGFYDNVDPTDYMFVSTQIALMHSELSEALEALRDGYLDIYFSQLGNKPEGMVIELSDCIIRIFDLCGALGLDLERALELKMEYNKTRSYKHSRKNF